MSTPAPHRIDVHHHVLPFENNDLQWTARGRRGAFHVHGFHVYKYGAN